MRRFLVIFSTLLLLASCTSQDKKQTKPVVITSIPPYVFFVNKIAPHRFSVLSLVPPGANPHFYEPMPQDVDAVQGAVLWIKLGEAFDQKVQKVFEERHAQLKIVDIAEGVDLLSPIDPLNKSTSTHTCHHHHEGKDLHIWLSPRLAKAQAKTIAAALCELFPHLEAEFTHHLQLFMEELDALDAEISSLIPHREGKAILTSHPAFAYFCQDYGLTQLSIEVEGKEPLPHHLTQILQQADAYRIQSVFLEPQYSNKGALLIAEHLHLPTYLIDPYAENYIDNMHLLAKIIAASTL